MDTFVRLTVRFSTYVPGATKIDHDDASSGSFERAYVMVLKGLTTVPS